MESKHKPEVGTLNSKEYEYQVIDFFLCTCIVANINPALSAQAFLGSSILLKWLSKTVTIV